MGATETNVNYIRHSFDREDAIKTHFSCFFFSGRRENRCDAAAAAAAAAGHSETVCLSFYEFATYSYLNVFRCQLEGWPFQRKQERVRETQNRASRKPPFGWKGSNGNCEEVLSYVTKTTFRLVDIKLFLLGVRRADRWRILALLSALHTGTSAINQTPEQYWLFHSALVASREGCYSMIVLRGIRNDFMDDPIHQFCVYDIGDWCTNRGRVKVHWSDVSITVIDLKVMWQHCCFRFRFFGLASFAGCHKYNGKVGSEAGRPSGNKVIISVIAGPEEHGIKW